MTSKPFDSTWKELVETDPGAWPAALGPWPAERVEMVDADLSTLIASADKVMRVVGPEGPWLLNLEAEARHAADAPQRLQEYATLLYRRHSLPVRSVVLLLRREAEASALTGTYELRLPGEAEPYLVFRYHVVRLWQLPVDRFLTGGLGTLPLAPLTDEAASRLPEVVGRIEQRLRAEADPTEANKLRAATFVLLGLRYSAEVAEQLYRGVTEMEESATYQLIISRGAVQGERETILRQGSKKFGPPPAEIRSRLEQVQDRDRLDQLADRLLDVNSWEELLAEPNL